MTVLRKPYLGTVRQWHWISSAVCLIGMLLFAVTGITLNHSGRIEARPQVTTVEATLPGNLLQEMQTAAQMEGALPESTNAWLQQYHALSLPARPAEWSADEAYLSLPRPGGDAWVSIDLETGEVIYEATDRGWISYFNDLHKGRHTGTAWSWFIDIFALTCVVFCLSGLVLLYRHAGGRPTTWPLVGLGLVIPVLLVVLFIH